MKAPVGLLSDRTVLRSKMEGLCPDKFRVVELSRVYHTIPQSASKTKRTTDRSRWFFSAGGAGATAGEFLSRHIVASVGALQAEKRRHLGTLQPLLVCFFQLVFVQGNAVQQITLILGSCIVINAEPFADCAELVKHFNSSRGHSFDFNIHGSTTFQERYVLKSESAALSASISMIGPPDCLAKTRIAPKSRI